MKNIGVSLLLSLLTACSLSPQRESIPVEERGAGTEEPAASGAVPDEGVRTYPVVPGGLPPVTPQSGTPRSMAPNTAVLALVEAAQAQKQQQNYSAAAASLERAIRIAPRDAQLYLQLAQIRHRQGNIAQADQLCKKAIALAQDVSQMRFECAQLAG